MFTSFKVGRQPTPALMNSTITSPEQKLFVKRFGSTWKRTPHYGVYYIFDKNTNVQVKMTVWGNQRPTLTFYTKYDHETFKERLINNLSLDGDTVLVKTCFAFPYEQIVQTMKEYALW